MERQTPIQGAKRSLDRRTLLKELGMAAGALLIEYPMRRLAAAQGAVKIGTLIPLTGPLAEFGPNFRKAADLAAGHLTAAGLSLQLMHADDETSAIPAVAAARKLVDVDRVSAVVGAAASGVTIPVAESVTIPNKVLQISNASTSPLITVLPADQGQDFLFRTCPSDALQGVVLGKLAVELQYKAAAAIYVNNPYGQGLADQFKKSFERRGGKVTAMVPHDETPAPTYVAELRKAVQDKPDVLAAISYPGHASIYLREAIEGNYIKKFLFCDGTKSLEVVKAIGEKNAEGMMGTAPGSVLTSGYNVFIAEYGKTYGEVPPLPYMTNMYDAVALIGLAVKAAQVEGVKQLTGVAIRDRLRKVANPPGEVVGPGAADLKKASQLLENKQEVNYEGAAGSCDFDELGDVVTPIEVWKFADGKIITVRLEYDIPKV
ncbi:MAG TPA: ABC transporter substrate-binding protein [Candidatus Tectomicrobia bacterium]|nr:ABC transporter substrate-binding protein [Candidatus Tectomicrobia bacterium]